MNEKFQAFLLTEFKKYEEVVGGWRPSISQWAKYLDVNEANLAHWIMGRRIPDIPNAIRLSRKLGPQVYDILGYDHYAQLDDPMLRFVAEGWETIDDETRAKIITTIKAA